MLFLKVKMLNFLKNSFKSLKKREWALWLGSLTLISVAFAFSSGKGVMQYIASLIGATSLIFIAKGNVMGQIITVAFSLMYGIISYFESYYGEMITYLGMTMPMAIVAVISWLKNPYKGDKTVVEVNKLRPLEYVLMLVVGLAVTTGFYFILRALNTANLIVSTLSVLTSFIPVYLTARRSPFYALGYALNDIVLIVLWSISSVSDLSNLSMVACFVVFLANDLYALTNWIKMQKSQAKDKE